MKFLEEARKKNLKELRQELLEESHSIEFRQGFQYVLFEEYQVESLEKCLEEILEKLLEGS